MRNADSECKDLLLRITSNEVSLWTRCAVGTQFGHKFCCVRVGRRLLSALESCVRPRSSKPFAPTKQDRDLTTSRAALPVPLRAARRL